MLSKILYYYLVLSVNTTSIQPLCYSGTGQISAIAYGGMGKYTYTWYSTTGIFTIIPQSTPEAIFQVLFRILIYVCVCVYLSLNYRIL